MTSPVLRNGQRRRQGPRFSPVKGKTGKSPRKRLGEEGIPEQNCSREIGRGIKEIWRPEAGGANGMRGVVRPWSDEGPIESIMKKEERKKGGGASRSFSSIKRYEA